MTKYQSVASEPRLLDSMVLFIDALGTEESARARVANAGSASNDPGEAEREEESPAEAVEARFQAFRKGWAEARYYAGLSKGSYIDTAAFSDLVVAGEPITDGHGEPALVTAVSAAATFQLFLSIEGLFARGAIVRGLMWMDEEIVFGPALIDAYKQERDKALYPRIVLSPDLAEWLRTYSKYYGNSTSRLPYKDLILVDRTGSMFVNYLTRIDVVDEDMHLRVELLEKHRDAVYAGLQDSQPHPRHHEKMLWVAGYHNYFVKSHYKDSPDLLVKPLDPLLAFVPLETYLDDNPEDDVLLFLDSKGDGTLGEAP